MIGLGLCTYNRIDYCKQVLDSLENHNWGGATLKVVYQDYSTPEMTEKYKELFSQYSDSNILFIQGTQNIGIGRAKNIVMMYLYENNCDYIFTMEDDVLMISDDTCQKYVDYGLKHNLKYLNFGLHGLMNKKELLFYYQGISCYPQCVGAFTMHSREVITEVGYHDENFYNAWEHVEYCKRCVDKGYTTPFWYFADCELSHLLLQEIPGSGAASIIGSQDNRNKNIARGQYYWIQKHGDFLPPKR
jgi:GT2 family glycosyltransferase